ncbi:hypothetical protein LS482_10985 [Sinomicrobium kalidii]|uniref:hypothetical protein n=1 Tax=Sinomicrobium kalidii TaxID=2900738 RepID=UPI001E39C940|nr:hypothetical protein [Sinomicrobium kalidii]UGU14237.1 hypothetical protein LS482_10985 [Sinomicrobium kalidii]
MLEKLLNQRLVLLSIILIMSCNDVKNSKKKVDAKSIVRDENSINPKTEKLKKYPKKDTIFLGFRLGMSKSEFDSHLKELIKKGKLKHSNNSILYSLNFKRQMLQNEDEYLFNDKYAKKEVEVEPEIKVINLSYIGVLKPKFGDEKLYELILTFKNTTNLRSQFALPYILENLIKDYGCFKNSKLAEYSCAIKENDTGGKETRLYSNGGVISAFRSINLENPMYKVDKALEDKYYKSLIENNEQNVSFYWWNFSNGFKISVRGEYGLPGSDPLGSNKVLLSEREIALTYLSNKDKRNYIGKQKEKVDIENSNSASDF